MGADALADPACLRGPGDLCRRGFALAQSLLEALERDGETYLAAMAEAVRNGLRHAEPLPILLQSHGFRRCRQAGHPRNAAHGSACHSASASSRSGRLPSTPSWEADP